MGCHILDPVFGVARRRQPARRSAPTARPRTRTTGGSTSRCSTSSPAPVHDRHLTLTGTTARPGRRRRSSELIGKHKLDDQGSIYIGTEGVLYSPYIRRHADPAAGREVQGLQAARRRRATNHYLQFVEAVPRQRQDLGPVQLLRPAHRDGPARLPGHPVPQDRPEWDTKALKVTNVAEANAFVRRTPRKGFETPGWMGTRNAANGFAG